MKHRVFLGAGLAVALLSGYAISEEALKSGLQVGERTTPFNVLNACNAELPQQAGKKSCLV